MKGRVDVSAKISMRSFLTSAIALVAAIAATALSGCGKQDAPSSSTSLPAASGNISANTFTILAGSELKDLEAAIVDASRKAGVEIKLSYAGTLDIVERINAGEKFDAILPPNGAYPSLALQAKPAAREKLFYSRIAFGIKSAKAQSLGWDKKSPSWAEIAKAAESGKLRYGMTNATSSNTGMSALFAVASASAGKSEDLSAQDVDAKILKAFLSGQKLTAGSSGWLADSYVKEAAGVDGMVNYEAMILRTNEKLSAADKLTLIYPRDGMISADYPLMLLNADKREAYQKITTALKAESFQRDAVSAAFLRPANPEVAASSALPSAAIAELSFPNRLEVIDAVLASYQSQWRKPSTSIFVLDVSGSMEGERINGMRDALKVLAGADTASASARYAAFQNRERVVLITFSSKVAEPVWVKFDGNKIEESRTALRTQADAMIAKGGTAIYDALLSAQDVATQELKSDPDRFVSIVLLTDGESNVGASFKDFQAKFPNGTPVRVFPILFGEGKVSEMKQLAQFTGGRDFDGRKAKLAAVFREIRGYQ